MGNPLAEYVHALPPYFDFSAANTWYDGLWGAGQQPPEGFPGLGESLIGQSMPPAFFPGDWARLRAASLRGLGQACDYVDSMGNCLDAQGNPTGGTVNAPAGGGSIPCLTGAYGPLQPGQVFCATGTTVSPGPSANLPSTPQPPTPTGMSTQTWVMLGMGAAVVLLFLMAVRR